jgi:hypothetical protein
VFVGGWLVGVDVGGVWPVPGSLGGGLVGQVLVDGSQGVGEGAAPGSLLLWQPADKSTTAKSVVAIRIRTSQQRWTRVERVSRAVEWF